MLKSCGAVAQGSQLCIAGVKAPVNPCSGSFSYALYVCTKHCIEACIQTLKFINQDKNAGSAQSWKSEIQKLGRGLGFVWAQQ